MQTGICELVRLGLQGYAQETPYYYLLKLARVRFLLADEAGAGKTIMAGLLLREAEASRPGRPRAGRLSR